MNYKGYIGSIEVGEEDNCLFGKVPALPHDTMITYEEETVAELREDFHGAVDDYLAYCEEEGIEPRKSYSGALKTYAYRPRRTARWPCLQNKPAFP